MTRLKFLLRCLLSAALIIFIARKVNWTELGTVLSRLDWRWALLGSLLSGALIAGLAFRWRIFIGQQRIELPFGKVLSLTWAGQFFNSVLPGSTGGDVFKIYQLCRLAPDRKAAAAATVLVDRFSALVALLGLSGIAFLIQPLPLRVLTGRDLALPGIWWLLLALVLALGAGWILFRLLRATQLFGRITRTLAAVLESASLNPGVVLALFLSFAIHVINFLTVYMFARSLGLGITFGQVLLMMPVVLLLVMLPITINGHGLRELLLISYFSQMGVRIDQRADLGFGEAAVALSVLMVANDLLWSLPGGIQYLTQFRLPRAPAPASSPA